MGTNLFLDTEFMEDGSTIELISIGLVSMTGETFYREIDVDLSKANDFVRLNVIPHLKGDPVSLAKVRDDLRWWVLEQTSKDMERPKFWAWYGAYDWVALCQMYGNMLDLPPNWPKYVCDFRQTLGEYNENRRLREQLHRAGDLPALGPAYEMPDKPEDNHHALADAQWLRKAYAGLRLHVANEPAYGSSVW